MHWCVVAYALIFVQALVDAEIHEANSTGTLELDGDLMLQKTMDKRCADQKVRFAHNSYQDAQRTFQLHSKNINIKAKVESQKLQISISANDRAKWVTQPEPFAITQEMNEPCIELTNGRRDETVNYRPNSDRICLRGTVKLYHQVCYGHFSPCDAASNKVSWNFNVCFLTHVTTQRPCSFVFPEVDDF